MVTYAKKFWQAWSDEEGTSTVEYALLVAAMVIVSIGAWAALGTSLRRVIGSTANSISNGFS